VFLNVITDPMELNELGSVMFSSASVHIEFIKSQKDLIRHRIILLWAGVFLALG